MNKELRAAALRILNGQQLSTQETNAILGFDKPSSAWYTHVTNKSWPTVRDQLLAENPKYVWPAGSPLTAFGPDHGSAFIFCKGDNTVWQGDNESYIRSICTKREF